MADRPLNAYPAYLFDLDGTLIYGPAPVPGAAAAVRGVRAAGRRVLVVTNNSMLSVHAIQRRLLDHGLEVAPDEIVTTVEATARFLAREHPGAGVFVFGSQALEEALARQGLRPLPDERGAEVVVVGTDRRLSYGRLTSAVRAVLAGARFVASNVDRIIIEDGERYPGAAAMLGAIAGVAGREPDAVVGKPSPILPTDALARLDLPPEECLFVGDSLITDLPAARAAGMPMLLVLSGVTSSADLARVPHPPEYVLNSVAPLAELFDQTGNS
ncbi:MAG: HAD-IIA family hydrolase [Chloroflexi bacterium]|nr:HAD-IIA family hydrolase [Chloroflexota bacterium]